MSYSDVIRAKRKNRDLNARTADQLNEEIRRLARGEKVATPIAPDQKGEQDGHEENTGRV